MLPMADAAAFSGSSTRYDPALAQEALRISELCYMPSMQKSILKISGFEQTGAFNYNRAGNDTRHAAAYTVYRRTAADGHHDVVIAIRGTGEGEWKLNMDLMPSGNYDLPYAENFMLAAEDILTAQSAFLESLVSPVFLVTGHSRGAAVANLLGARLTDDYGKDSVFVYTFATPRTVRAGFPEYENIFNIIHPGDIVTYLPLPQWGFVRCGTDIVLPVTETGLYEAAEKAYLARSDASEPFSMMQADPEQTQQMLAAMASLAPDLTQTYAVPRAFAHPGAASDGEDGITAGEFFLRLMDGTLMNGTEPSPLMMSLMSAENDFTPFLHALQSTQGSSFSALISGAHLPASYGAWLTAMDGVQ